MSVPRATFDHIGVVTSERKAGERWVEATRVWVTSPRDHPYNVEWLRYEDDSPVSGPLRTEPHVAYRVPDVDAAIEGKSIVLAPFEVADGFLRVAFIEDAGTLIEFMQYRDPDEEGWF